MSGLIAGFGGASGTEGAFTPTGTWATNTSYSGYYSVLNNYMSGFVRVSFSGAPDAGALKIGVMPAGWELDVSRYPGGSASAFHLGSGTILDASLSAYYGFLSLTWDTTTTVNVWYGAGTLAQMTRTAPITLANGDQANIYFNNIPVVRT